MRRQEATGTRREVTREASPGSTSKPVADQQGWYWTGPKKTAEPAPKSV